MGRSYLPFEQYPGESTPAVMRRVAARARSYYRETKTLASRLPNDGSRAALLAASVVYESILDGLEVRGYDPLGGRVSVSEVGKMKLVARCMLSAYTGFATIR